MQVTIGSPTAPPVVIKISPDEAGILRAIFQHVGGSPGAGRPRGFISRLDRALSSAGVEARTGLVDCRYPHIIRLNNPEDQS